MKPMIIPPFTMKKARSPNKHDLVDEQALFLFTVEILVNTVVYVVQILQNIPQIKQFETVKFCLQVNHF